MPNKSNSNKNIQLGEPVGTACSRLRKHILYDLLMQLNKAYCFQCKKLIKGPEDLSIEHKIPWLNSCDPVGLFFDLNNIAFSHTRCNIMAARKPSQRYFTAEDRLAADRNNRARVMRNSYTPQKRRERYLRTGH